MTILPFSNYSFVGHNVIQRLHQCRIIEIIMYSRPYRLYVETPPQHACCMRISDAIISPMQSVLRQEIVTVSTFIMCKDNALN
jgi:hypothetical protein